MRGQRRTKNPNPDNFRRADIKISLAQLEAMHDSEGTITLIPSQGADSFIDVQRIYSKLVTNGNAANLTDVTCAIRIGDNLDVITPANDVVVGVGRSVFSNVMINEVSANQHFGEPLLFSNGGTGVMAWDEGEDVNLYMTIIYRVIHL